MQKDLISLHQIKKSLKSKGFGIILLIFSIPIAIPLPYPPGFTTILGLPLFIFSLQFYLKHSAPWLPNALAQKTFERQKIAAVLEKLAPFIKKLEKLSRQRFYFFDQNSLAYKILGIFMIINSIFIILPIIFANSTPALGTSLIAMGLIRRDGIFAIAGMIISIIGWTIGTTVLFIGVEFIKNIFN